MWKACVAKLAEFVTSDTLHFPHAERILPEQYSSIRSIGSFSDAKGVAFFETIRQIGSRQSDGEIDILPCSPCVRPGA